MTDEPREYDREFTARISRRSRRRIGINTNRGQVTRFVLQLEYLLDPDTSEWVEVVRYDHDESGSDEATHDVTEDGLHIDVYRDGEKSDSHELTPPLSGGEALTRAKNI